MNLSAKGGETDTYQNVFEAAFLASATEITVDHHPLGNCQQPHPVPSWRGIRPDGIRVRTEARWLKGTPVKLF